MEKAIYQVEEAIKKRKADNTTNLTTLEHLKKLLSDEGGEGKHIDASHSITSSNIDAKPLPEKEIAPTSNAGDDQLEGVENPLQLLARASDLRIASPLTPPGGSISTPGTWLSSEHGPYMDVQRFFLPMKANLDQGPGLDPIEVGLVTAEEAEMLLAYFHKHLAHTRMYLSS